MMVVVEFSHEWSSLSELSLALLHIIFCSWSQRRRTEGGKRMLVSIWWIPEWVLGGLRSLTFFLAVIL